MASATPDLRLPSQPQCITAPWPVPNYTAWWQRHMCVNNLPKVVTRKRNGRDSKPRPFESQVQRSNRSASRPHWSNEVAVLGSVFFSDDNAMSWTYCFANNVVCARNAARRRRQQRRVCSKWLITSAEIWSLRLQSNSLTSVTRYFRNFPSWRGSASVNSFENELFAFH